MHAKASQMMSNRFRYPLYIAVTVKHFIYGKFGAHLQIDV